MPVNKNIKQHIMLLKKAFLQQAEGWDWRKTSEALSAEHGVPVAQIDSLRADMQPTEKAERIPKGRNMQRFCAWLTKRGLKPFTRADLENAMPDLSRVQGINLMSGARITGYIEECAVTRRTSRLKYWRSSMTPTRRFLAAVIVGGNLRVAGNHVDARPGADTLGAPRHARAIDAEKHAIAVAGRIEGARACVIHILPTEGVEA
jgi:hypothetical protein